jgi:hypothetical protein
MACSAQNDTMDRVENKPVYTSYGARALGNDRKNMKTARVEFIEHKKQTRKVEMSLLKREGFSD